MGDIQDNHKVGRDYQTAAGHRICASVGCGSGNYHLSFDLGPLNTTTAAAFAAAAGVAHTSGQAAWESHMSGVSGWSSWYGGLTASQQAGLYESMRHAGQYGLTP